MTRVQKYVCIMKLGILYCIPFFMVHSFINNFVCVKQGDDQENDSPTVQPLASYEGCVSKCRQRSQGGEWGLCRDAREEIFDSFFAMTVHRESSNKLNYYVVVACFST